MLVLGYPTKRDKWKHPVQPRVAKRSKGWKTTREAESERTSIQAVFWQRRRSEVAKLPFSLKTCWLRSIIIINTVFSDCDRRRRVTEISRKLETIHPNPGPGKRNKTEEGKKLRREKKYEKRKEKRNEHANTNKNKFLNIITWNVQGMSMDTRNQRKLREVVKYVQRNKWDAALLTEVRSKTSGTIWLGEGENLVAVRHTKRAAIMLTGKLLKSWCEDGQRAKEDERTITVKTGGLTLISTYLPVYQGNNEQQIEEEKDILKQHISEAKSDEVLIVGGDFNAHIGADEDRPGTCGKYGLRVSNHSGTELLDWCQENSLCYVNSFYQHRRRGTWFSIPLQRWYEIDGFLMNNQQRHKHVRKVCTIGEASLSDHKPKKIKIEMKEEKKIRRNKPKKRPRILWEKLRNNDTAMTYRGRINELLEEGEEMETGLGGELGNWNKIAKILTQAAEDTCGLEEKQVENPWMVGRDEEINQMRIRVTAALTARNDLLASQNLDNVQRNIQLEAIRNELKQARTVLKRTTARWEKEYWQEIIDECKEAGETNNSSQMYKSLKKLGQRGLTKSCASTKLTKEDFKTQFENISKNRFENDPREIDEMLRKVKDISNTAKAKEWNEHMNTIPSNEEIFEQMNLMRESAPGEDNVRMIYIRMAGPEIHNEVCKLVRYMFTSDAAEWEEALKIGLVIPLFKKGDKDDSNNYRGVVLLAMASRILARILANRLRLWAEALGLMDDDQAGFRKGRSTCDVTQVMYRIQEDVEDLQRRIHAGGETFQEDNRPTARLLDLKKAYPRVNKYALWEILKKYGLEGNGLETIQKLHETTKYKVKSREGESEAWTQDRGLREGCPSSPILFNVFHQVVMRIAATARKRKAVETDMEVGISFHWVPGSSFPGNRTWEKHNSEAKRIRIDKALFADDTTLAGKKKEIDQGVEEVKKVMNAFEERNNDNKEETLDFGKEEGNKIRMLGSWMGWQEDINQRIKRAGSAWIKVKNRLKGSKLSKKMKARIVEACVESTLLFDCQARSWQKGEIKRLQKFMDKRYRTVWCRGNQPPLMQMQAEQRNMQDVRNDLGVKSLRLKIEKRVLERIGHVMRMPDDRMVKAAVLGWLADLEQWEKVPGKKRKTVLYWKGLIKEAGLDYTQIGNMTQDRDNWKAIVRDRVKHMEQWEKAGGKQTIQNRGQRSSPQEETSLVCQFENCGKVCKSKAGLTIHVKRMHEESSQKVDFKCNNCNKVFKQEANLLNHRKKCTGEDSAARVYVPRS